MTKRDEPCTDEEIPYLMGQYQRKGQVAAEKVNELVMLGRGRGILVVKDDRGDAWDVVDRHWESSIPHGLRWQKRGYAWLHWLGLGEPDDLELVVVANPKKLGEIAFADALVMLEEQEGEDGRDAVVKNLHVVPLQGKHVGVGGDA